MFGKLRKSALWATILVAGGVVLSGSSIPAQAADLGGDCCADLEERIAELEATAARKGNRKVSLTIYGKVNQSAMYWDDGQEQNTYLVTNDASRTRFGFKGKAKITSDLSAYYKLEVGIRTANSKRTNQFDYTASRQEPAVRHAEWGLKSKHWGQFGVGLQKNITKDITKANVAGTGDVGKYSDAEDYGGGFFLVAKGQPVSRDGTQWRRLITRTGASPGEGDRINSVVYYTPSWHGFRVGAVYGQDHTSGIGVLYSNKIGSWKIKGGAAYMKVLSDEDRAALHGCPGRNANSGSPFEDRVNNADCEGIGGSIAVMDTHHGLYAQFAAGWMQDETVFAQSNFVGTNVDNEYWFWAMEAGIQQKWNHLGSTTIFGQYYKYDGGAINQTVDENDPINPFGADAKIASSEVDYWGIGIMQKIDAAEMKLYSLWRHYSFDLTLADGGEVRASAPLEDYDAWMSGAVIYF